MQGASGPQVEWMVASAQPCPCAECAALLAAGDHNEAAAHCWCGPEIHSALCAADVVVHTDFRG